MADMNEPRVDRRGGLLGLMHRQQLYLPTVHIEVCGCDTVLQELEEGDVHILSSQKIGTARPLITGHDRHLPL